MGIGGISIWQLFLVLFFIVAVLFLVKVIRVIYKFVVRFLSNNKEKSSKEEGSVVMFNFAKKRINKLVEKAESGDIEAQYQLGYNYDKGIDVKVDKDLAWHWMSMSADGGFAEAQATLSAFIFRDYSGDNSKLVKAFSLAQASANQGNGFGFAMLGRFYSEGSVVEEDLDKALELYKAAYKKGFTKARKGIKQLEMYKFQKNLTSRANL